MFLLLAFLLVVIVAWLALHVVMLRPKLHSYRVSTGVYDRLGAAEGAFWRRTVIRLEGAKVGIVALVTSMVPIVGPIYAQASGTDWTKYLPDGQARTMGLVLMVAGFVGPMIFNALHASEMAKAAAATPVPLSPAGATAPTITSLTSIVNGNTASIASSP